MAASKFPPREMADEYVETALRAASFFTRAEIDEFDHFKIGYVVRRNEGYVTFFKYRAPYNKGDHACQQILMKGPALEHMVERLAGMEDEKAKALLSQMREGLGMIRVFAGYQSEKPKGCSPA